MDLLQFQQNLKSIDVWEILIPIIEKNLNQIERLNKEQLQKGLTATGNPTKHHSGSARSDKYVNSKIQRGVYDPSIYPSVNLYNTGDFYRKLTAKMDMMYVVYIESYDAKADMLEEMYGSVIYGLAPESLGMFVDLIIDDFRAKLLTELTK